MSRPAFDDGVAVLYAILTDVGAPVWRAVLMMAYTWEAIAISGEVDAERAGGGGIGFDV